MTPILKVRMPDGTVVDIPAIIGPRGIGISTAFINDSGELLIVYTNGEVINVGSVRGGGLTDDEKAEILNTINNKADKLHISYEEYTGLLVLYHNTESRLGVMDNIVLSIPSNFSDDYTSSFSFKSGETATSLIYPSTPVVWRGDDCDEDGEFIPEANTSYEVSVKYLGDDSEGNAIVVARVGAF